MPLSKRNQCGFPADRPSKEASVEAGFGASPWDEVTEHGFSWRFTEIVVKKLFFGGSPGKGVFRGFWARFGGCHEGSPEFHGEPFWSKGLK